MTLSGVEEWDVGRGMTATDAVVVDEQMTIHRQKVQIPARHEVGQFFNVFRGQLMVGTMMMVMMMMMMLQMGMMVNRMELGMLQRSFRTR